MIEKTQTKQEFEETKFDASSERDVGSMTQAELDLKWQRLLPTVIEKFKEID